MDRCVSSCWSRGCTRQVPVRWPCSEVLVAHGGRSWSAARGGSEPRPLPGQGSALPNRSRARLPALRCRVPGSGSTSRSAHRALFNSLFDTNTRRFSSKIVVNCIFPGPPPSLFRNPLYLECCCRRGGFLQTRRGRTARWRVLGGLRANAGPFSYLFDCYCVWLTYVISLKHYEFTSKTTDSAMRSSVEKETLPPLSSPSLPDGDFANDLWDF